MTVAWRIQGGLMSQLQKCGVVGMIFTIMCCLCGQALARALTEQHLHTGFALAQACEKEIDDDMTDYGQCVGHAMDRVTGQRRVLLGVHFQAWLMADLAARQNSTGALAQRKHHAHGIFKEMRATKTTFAQLCQAKQMDCKLIKERLAQRFQ